MNLLCDSVHFSYAKKSSECKYYWILNLTDDSKWIISISNFAIFNTALVEKCHTERSNWTIFLQSIKRYRNYVTFLKIRVFFILNHSFYIYFCVCGILYICTACKQTIYIVCKFLRITSSLFLFVQMRRRSYSAHICVKFIAQFFNITGYCNPNKPIFWFIALFYTNFNSSVDDIQSNCAKKTSFLLLAKEQEREMELFFYRY